MMDVELINDGPVGVDYVCEDEQVNLPSLASLTVCFFACSSLILASLLTIVLAGHDPNR